MNRSKHSRAIFTGLAALLLSAASGQAAQYQDNHSRGTAYPFSGEGCLANELGLATAANGQTDYFEINVVQGQQRLQIDSTPANLTFELLDSQGLPVMGNGADLDAEPHAIDQFVAAGQYFLAVSGPASNYDLCWQTQAAIAAREDGYEPNNDSARATDMRDHPQRWLTAALGEFGRQLDADWFRVGVSAVAANEQLVALVQTSSYEGVVDLALFDASGNQVNASVSSEGRRDATILRADVVAGDYFIQVTSTNKGKVYDLCWGMSSARAPELGLSCSDQPVTGSRAPQAAVSSSSAAGGGGAGGLEVALLILLVTLFAKWRRDSIRNKADSE